MARATNYGIMSQQITDIVNACNRAEKLIESGDVRSAIETMSPYFGAWWAAKVSYSYARVHHIEVTRQYWHVVRTWDRWSRLERAPRLVTFQPRHRSNL